MRRAQTFRHQPRHSFNAQADDLGLLKEQDESTEDALRRQLLTKDKDIEKVGYLSQNSPLLQSDALVKLKALVNNLQEQLGQRITAEQHRELLEEMRSQEILLEGTQRENERCMSKLESMKVREKLLERELAAALGDNWQAKLGISLSPTHGSRNSIGSINETPAPPTSEPNPVKEQATRQIATESSPEASLQHIERIRLLILGMEQRIQNREDNLTSVVKKAEDQVAKLEVLRQEVNTLS